MLSTKLDQWQTFYHLFPKKVSSLRTQTGSNHRKPFQKQHLGGFDHRMWVQVPNFDPTAVSNRLLILDPQIGYWPVKWLGPSTSCIATCSIKVVVFKSFSDLIPRVRWWDRRKQHCHEREHLIEASWTHNLAAEAIKLCHLPFLHRRGMDSEHTGNSDGSTLAKRSIGK